MTKEEALKIIKRNCTGGSQLREACAMFIPELRESEDERIMAYVVLVVKDWWSKIAKVTDDGTWPTEDEMLACLEKQKEQKPADCGFEVGDTITDGNSTFKVVGIKDGYYIADDGDKVCCYVAHRYYTTIEHYETQKPAECSEEDEKRVAQLIYDTEHIRAEYEKSKKEFGERFNDDLIKDCDEQIAWLKSLLKRFNLPPKQESEPLEIKYAEKIYKVYGTKELPGGVVGYIIEDELGHYDCIIHPDEVLGGGYGIESNGSLYPAKEANFGQPHWKPSEEQMEAFRSYIKDFQEKAEAAVGGWNNFDVMIRLYEQLKKLM